MTRSGRVLGLTGAFGYIGRRLLARLAGSDAFDRIVCTDILPRPDDLPVEVAFRHCDIRDNDRLFSIFQETGVTTVVHLAFIAEPTRNPEFERDVDVNGTRNVMEACARLGIERLVVASSDCAYGFFPDTPDYLNESAPIRPTLGFPYSENKAEIETMLAHFQEQNSRCSVVILRPCMVMGPKANNTTTRSMKQPVMIRVRGCDPIMQFVHEDDAAEAFFLAATKDVRGAFNLAADAGLRYTELARELGKPMIALPVWLLYPLVESLYRIKLLPFGKAQLDYIRHPLSMDIEKVKDVLGFQPRYTSRQTIQAFKTAR